MNNHKANKSIHTRRRLLFLHNHVLLLSHIEISNRRRKSSHRKGPLFGDEGEGFGCFLKSFFTLLLSNELDGSVDGLGKQRSTLIASLQYTRGIKEIYIFSIEYKGYGLPHGWERDGYH